MQKLPEGVMKQIEMYDSSGDILRVEHRRIPNCRRAVHGLGSFTALMRLL
jgi:hypothetical protein